MLKDDPYYLLDEDGSKTKEQTIEAIPVVRLDDMPPIPIGQDFLCSWILPTDHFVHGQPPSSHNSSLFAPQQPRRVPS
jgi:hypothetical protein